ISTVCLSFLFSFCSSPSAVSAGGVSVAVAEFSGAWSSGRGSSVIGPVLSCAGQRTGWQFRSRQVDRETCTPEWHAVPAWEAPSCQECGWMIRVEEVMDTNVTAPRSCRIKGHAFELPVRKDQGEGKLRACQFRVRHLKWRTRKMNTSR